MKASLSAARQARAKHISATFRDPGGTLVHTGGEVLRVINARGLRDLSAFMQSGVATEFMKCGDLVETTLASPAESQQLLSDPAFRAIYTGQDGQAILRHKKVWFPSYPHEWPAEMLHAAADLTLRLARRSLEEGLGLKDATPYNVLFEATKPLFVDFLSFERRDPSDPTWMPYAQFVRTFLIPLLLNQKLGLGLERAFYAQPEGISPEEAYALTPWARRLSPRFFTLVCLPTWLNNATGPEIYRQKKLSAEKSKFVLQSLFRGLKRSVSGTEPSLSRSSSWSNYSTCNSYSDDQLNAKRDFVETALSEFHPRRVLDIGSNDGTYSRIASRKGASVVAIDTDATVVGKLWKQAQSEQLNILPLVVNLARPTPALGWRNREYPSFLERASASFDVVLMLAVLHHLLVSDQVPLEEVLDVAAELTTDLVLIEFVAPDDPEFRALTRGRGHLYADFSLVSFENSCSRRFHVIQSRELPGSCRRLYLLRKKGSTGHA